MQSQSTDFYNIFDVSNENQKAAKLYKEESSRLFEAVVYTDFFGVFDEASPNGIIQTEVNKRFNVETSRLDMGNKCWAFLFPPLFLAEGIGFFQFFDAKFRYSKIEKNNKFLLPQSYENLDQNGSVISTEFYYSPLLLYQHRNSFYLLQSSGVKKKGNYPSGPFSKDS